MSYKLAGVIWNDDGTMAKEGYVVQYQGIPLYEILKAFEIIKKKGVNVFELRYSFSLTEYNICKGIENEELTQEEYETLKKVLL